MAHLDARIGRGVVTELRLRTASRAEDAGFLAMRDIAAIATNTGIEYRIVGGQMVRLHVALAGVAEPTVRVTLDADMGVAAASARNPALVAGLEALGYTRPGAQNPFIREAEDGMSVSFSLVIPSITSALCLKTLGWSDRLATKDAVDVWRLLRAHRQHIPEPIAWPASGVQGDAVAILRSDFARPAGAGVRAASPERADQAEIRALTLAVLHV